MPPESRTSADILKLVRPDILAMLGYEPIEPSDLLAERLGIPADRIVKLDANENPYGPSPAVLTALAEFDGYHRYPDPQQRRLRAALAEYTGVGPEHIVAGHGSDELIDLLLRAVIAPGDAVIDCPPTFGMYGFLARVAGGKVIEAPRRDDFTPDVQAVQNAASDAKIIIIASPNNPTGALLRPDELSSLLAAGLLVVVDEAYGEFAGESFAPLALQRENLVVLRTFSKWAGLAGLRAGYGIMPPALAQVLMQMKQPYTPNVAAEVAMLVSLEQKEPLMEGVRTIVEERERMRGLLAALEFVEVFPSQANFLLCRLTGVEARDAHARLAEQGIFVRYFETPRLRDCLRISVGLPSQTDRLVEALQEIGDERGR
ncbi:MAG: histidinol-phosphate transaminase [Chloroflexi bacterium]|nr:histidinol-phosphate transaminase [Chloroflexota bacterium]